MRLAWFAPLSPRLSGLATYSAAILPALARDADIDVFVSEDDPAELAPRLGPGTAVHPAYDFVWMRARRPYDLTVYQLANSASHAWMWAYALRFPGLAMLHDLVLHHARGAYLRRADRLRAYRAEMRFDRPELGAGVSAIDDLAIPHLLAAWPLVRPILATSRRCAVHDARAARDLRGRYPGSRVDVVRFGVPDPPDAPLPPAGNGPAVFAALPHTACVRSVRQTLRALARVRRETPATLRIVGPCEDGLDLGSAIADAGVDPGAVDGPSAPGSGAEEEGLLACDVCVCLGSLAALDTTDTWMRCLAAGRATVVSARARGTGVPLIDARTWRNLHGGPGEGIAVAVDPRHEAESLWLAMRRLAVDDGERRALGQRARSWFRAQSGTASGMIEDYGRLIHEAAGAPSGSDEGLPRHFRPTGLALARTIAEDCGVDRESFDLDPAGNR